MLDEAYGETAPAGTLPSIDALIDMPNVDPHPHLLESLWPCRRRASAMSSRTPGTAQAFDKIRNHFGMNRIGDGRGARGACGPGLSDAR